MTSITVTGRQSWPDLAIQGYGNLDALRILVQDNVTDENEVDLAAPCILAGVQVRDTDPLRNDRVLAQLGGTALATYTEVEHLDFDPRDYSTDYN